MTKTPDPRGFSDSQRDKYVKLALERAREIAETTPHGNTIFSVYKELLKFVVPEIYLGGCHDTSAVLHMLLSEQGVPSTLCIGEVGAGSKFFDHSWVEVEGAIYDVAVCMPNEIGTHVGGPVFHSTDLASAEPTDLAYGEESGEGLGSDACYVLSLNLTGYASIQPPMNVWILAVAMASRAGMHNPTFEHFKKKYGQVRRTLRKRAQTIP